MKIKYIIYIVIIGYRQNDVYSILARVTTRPKIFVRLKYLPFLDKSGRFTLPT